MNLPMKQFHLDEKNYTILIVDDTESNVRLLSFVLREAGYQVIVAFNGSDALQLISQRNPDLILMDVLMPDMSGYDVTAKIKERSDFSATPIIFITALSDLGDKLKAFKAGGVDFISKPFQKDEVLVRIKTHLFLQDLLKERDSRIEQLKSQEKEVHFLNAINAEFLRILKHDIDGPLNNIYGVSSLLIENKALDADALEMTQLILNSTQKLIVNVNRLYNNNIQTEPNNVLNIEPSNVTNLLNRIIELTKPKANLKGIDLELIHTLKSSTFFIDEIKLEIAIYNLVSNALKFTPPGGSVVIKVTEKPEHLVITVKDNGIGIPQHLQKYLFLDASKAKQAGTDGEIGSGLGLDIVQDYIHLHDGTIEVKSQKNKGTEFNIFIPILENQ